MTSKCQEKDKKKKQILDNPEYNFEEGVAFNVKYE